jgi:hypothetical protein
VPSAGDGAQIYKASVATMELGLEQVAAHYAISSIFSSFAERDGPVLLPRAAHLLRHSHLGPRPAGLGRAHIASAITGQQQSFSFAVLHFGDQNITAAVKPYTDADAAAFDAFAEKAEQQVQRAAFPEVIRLLDRDYGAWITR